MPNNRFLPTLAVSGALAFGAIACGGEEEQPAASGGAAQEESGASTENLSGTIAIDGSSTVQPFAEAAAELFQEQAPNVRITVNGAGTGDGFERFCSGETQISTASRPIEDDERETCGTGNVEFSEVQVANDGVAVITNSATQVDCFTTAQLKRLLRPNSNVDNLSQLGGSFPDQAVSFFTPGEESGTFDFFTEVVLETDAQERTENVQTSANDNQLITGVSGTEGAIGYVGYSFAEEAGDQVRIAQIDGGDGCIAPSAETIQNGTYQPLARPLFLYPNLEALQQPAIRGFMDFVLENHQRISEAAKIVPMTEEQAQESKGNLTTPSTGA